METLLKTTGGAFMKDLVFLMKHESEFLSQSAQEREKAIHSHLGESYPQSLVTYMTQLNVDQFKKEFHHVVQVLEEVAQPDPENGFLNALADFLAKEIGMMLDALSLDFFFRPLKSRLQALEGMLPKQSTLGKVLKYQFCENTYQELTADAQKALETLKKAPVVVVQTPIEMDGAMRKEVREHFAQKHPHAFVEFQINPKILGGMRLFVNGEVEDLSWLAKVQAITRLKAGAGL